MSMYEVIYLEPTEILAFSAPLLLGGCVKIAYDLPSYRSFVHIKPPEERQVKTQLRPTVRPVRKREATRSTCPARTAVDHRVREKLHRWVMDNAGRCSLACDCLAFSNEVFIRQENHPLVH